MVATGCGSIPNGVYVPPAEAELIARAIEIHGVRYRHWYQSDVSAEPWDPEHPFGRPGEGTLRRHADGFVLRTRSGHDVVVVCRAIGSTPALLDPEEAAALDRGGAVKASRMLLWVHAGQFEPAAMERRISLRTIAPELRLRDR